MRLFIYPFAPNAMRVHIFLAEKGLSLPLVDASEDRPGFRAINPLGQVPALELDDGSIITESLTICQYLDAKSGYPSLFGTGDEQRLRVAMWERRAEMRLLNPSVEYGHHVHPMFAQFIAQFPDYAATLVPRAEQALGVFADRLDDVAYVAGDRFTIADITTILGYAGLVGYGAVSPSDRPSIRRWSTAVIARESMAAVRETMAWFGARPLD